VELSSSCHYDLNRHDTPHFGDAHMRSVNVSIIFHIIWRSYLVIFEINLFNIIMRLWEAILHGEFFSKLLLQYFIRFYTRDYSLLLLVHFYIIRYIWYESALVIHRVKCKSMQMQNLKVRILHANNDSKHKRVF